MSEPFAEGERVLLVDTKKRHYLVTLKPGGEFHTHKGYVHHDELIGRHEGCEVTSTRLQTYTALRPTLEDVILLMPRGAQVIYPKDIGAIVTKADIFPGARVFETGVGSGALSMAMLRAGADIVGYEVREDFANRARTNVAEFLGEAVLARYRVELADSYSGIEPAHLPGGQVDRIVLDLPEPWQVVPHAEAVLASGGVLCAYTPSVVQVSQVRDALAKGPWVEVKTLEVLHRTWHVEGVAVRPDHRMVAHTAFLTFARLAVGKPASVDRDPPDLAAAGVEEDDLDGVDTAG
jgi:tRNA (adenine57-N1/adenine58-N1)-methyltransferase